MSDDSYINRLNAQGTFDEPAEPEFPSKDELAQQGFQERESTAQQLPVMVKEAPYAHSTRVAEANWAEAEAKAVEPEPTVSPRAELLREAEQLITGDRNQSYGSPTQNFDNIAALWTVQFGHLLKPGAKFTAAHVAQAQIHVKQARLIAQPKRDNYTDIAGYAACGWEAEDA